VALRRRVPEDWEEALAAYVQALTPALGLEPAAEDYLLGVDAPLAAAQRLRGALFGAQLRAYLVREWDEEWFRSARAAKFLVELWREGTRYRVEELLRFMGYEGFDTAPLLAEASALQAGAR
jgi:hypothetical protein